MANGPQKARRPREILKALRCTFRMTWICPRGILVSQLASISSCVLRANVPVILTTRKLQENEMPKKTSFIRLVAEGPTKTKDVSCRT